MRIALHRVYDWRADGDECPFCQCADDDHDDECPWNDVHMAVVQNPTLPAGHDGLDVLIADQEADEQRGDAVQAERNTPQPAEWW